MKLANVICANTGLTRVQRDAFRLATFPDDFVDCDDLPPLNLEPWRESPESKSLHNSLYQPHGGFYVLHICVLIVYGVLLIPSVTSLGVRMSATGY